MQSGIPIDFFLKITFQLSNSSAVGREKKFSFNTYLIHSAKNYYSFIIL